MMKATEQILNNRDAKDAFCAKITRKSGALSGVEELKKSSKGRRNRAEEKQIQTGEKIYRTIRHYQSSQRQGMAFDWKNYSTNSAQFGQIGVSLRRLMRSLRDFLPGKCFEEGSNVFIIHRP